MKEILNFNDLLGETITDINLMKDNYDEIEQIVFTINDGRQFRLYHEQDCCERVIVDDINGNMDDLKNSPLTLVHEASSDNLLDLAAYCFNEKIKMPTTMESEKEEDESESVKTWTFYKMATINGFVDIKWIGSSNGYYSTRVNFSEIDGKNV